VVQLHEGTISARSAGTGLGAEFTVSLPAASATAAAPAGQTLLQQPQTNYRPMRIIVVEDNRDAADVLKTLLEAHGHTVLAAYDGAEALRQVVAFAPDVALLDVGLPAMDGHELARRLRAACGPRTATLVALTGYGQPQDRQRSK